jgi:hypothetical protein
MTYQKAIALASPWAAVVCVAAFGGNVVFIGICAVCATALIADCKG